MPDPRAFARDRALTVRMSKSASSAVSGRVLHWALKVVDWSANMEFFTNILAMQILRHELEDGGRRRKCILGYGPEEAQFTLELLHDSAWMEMDPGNGFGWLTIQSPPITQSILKSRYPTAQLPPGTGKGFLVKSPDGYPFRILEGLQEGDPIKEVGLLVSSLDRSLEYWASHLEMSVLSRGGSCAVLKYGPGQCRLALQEVGQPIRVGTACGRLTISCTETQLLHVKKVVGPQQQTFPCGGVGISSGPAEDQGVVLLDPDGHEIYLTAEDKLPDLTTPSPKVSQDDAT